MELSRHTDNATDHPSVTGARPPPIPLPVRLWLVAIAAMIFAMVIVGGATRLTDSGLSITEWKPLLGALPPLSDADWRDVFAKYRQIPEYRLVNQGMSLADFKAIFWWEWGHRLLGRLIGVVFFVPMVIFWLRGAIARDLMPKLVAVFVLGGLQGLLGWYMVKSGLVDRVDVSQYRLAAHLGLAVAIYGLVIWIALAGGSGPRSATASRATIGGVLLLGLVYLQILLGALVAGLDAGLAHNTWPLMAGRWLPEGLAAMSPGWRNLFENALTVQFDHRIVAYAILAGLGAHLWSLGRAGHLGVPGPLRTSALAAAIAALAQVGLGIWTLLAHVPLALALAHQAGALILFATLVWHLGALVQGKSAT